ncbi:MAG: tRNA (adenosine(37)-N6)-threonylcarbamoyltransferase complex transferase subunit TsaD [Candidatus Cloacimonetes bacterium]|nr:tRNA (adenosine(37)-N6)-threonylcarbamoyltransferase complex transferase subunit TsaD [Candidatus Cloacimonadota bacterium]
MNSFNILAIETSCDDTAVALINSEYQVLANLVSTQDIHQHYGGVVPELASRMHIKYLMTLTDECLTKANVTLAEIDAVAVAVNPGLIGSLLVGTSFAKSLAYSLNKPLIAVNHMLGHVFANKIAHPHLIPPFLALVVSGGHTELVNFSTFKNFHIIGRTHDDAAGEAFDKVAKLLGLGYPGGPIIDNLAKNGDPNFVDFPRAFKQRDNYDFSFSGLKTAILNYLNDKSLEYINEHRADIAASVQMAIIEPLVTKTIRFAQKNNIGYIVLAGGVSANSLLRKLMHEETEKIAAKLFYPPLTYCMDNAAMIGAAAIEKYKEEDFAGLGLNPFPTKGLRLV